MQPTATERKTCGYAALVVLALIGAACTSASGGGSAATTAPGDADAGELAVVTADPCTVISDDAAAAIKIAGLGGGEVTQPVTKHETTSEPIRRTCTYNGSGEGPLPGAAWQTDLTSVTISKPLPSGCHLGPPSGSTPIDGIGDTAQIRANSAEACVGEQLITIIASPAEGDATDALTAALAEATTNLAAN